MIPIDSSYAMHFRKNVSNENEVLKHKSEIFYFYYFFFLIQAEFLGLS